VSPRLAAHEGAARSCSWAGRELAVVTRVTMKDGAIRTREHVSEAHNHLSASANTSRSRTSNGRTAGRLKYAGEVLRARRGQGAPALNSNTFHSGGIAPLTRRAEDSGAVSNSDGGADTLCTTISSLRKAEIASGEVAHERWASIRKAGLGHRITVATDIALAVEAVVRCWAWRVEVAVMSRVPNAGCAIRAERRFRGAGSDDGMANAGTSHQRSVGVAAIGGIIHTLEARIATSARRATTDDHSHADARPCIAALRGVASHRSAFGRIRARRIECAIQSGVTRAGAAVTAG